MTLDRDLLLAELTLIGPASRAEVVEAITDPPVVTRTLDGASTLDVTLSDHSRRLIRSGLFSTRSWATVRGLAYELVSVRKAGDRLQLTLEDSLVAALRRRRDPLTAPAGSTTRAEWVRRLCGEAQVPVMVDPAPRGPATEALTRNADNQGQSSWEALGEAADGAGWRRFSDGLRVLVGSDEWLGTLNPPWRVHEYAGPVHGVDLELDVGQPASSATVEVDAALWSALPGQPVELVDLGPGDGPWLVETFTRALTRSRAQVKLTRRRAVLPEPPPEADPGSSEAGEPDLVPTNQRQTAPATGGGKAATGARERMVAAALTQQGKPYVWGGKNGRPGWDCSGLVAYASRTAGRELSGGSKQQHATCRAQRRMVPVQEAVRTRGALLFRMNTEPTHVAISLGDGRTIEARGRAYGTGVFGNAAGRPWTGGALWL